MGRREKRYKVVSASAATIETVAKPAVKHSHKIMMEGSRQIHSGIATFLDTIDHACPTPLNYVILTQLFKGLKSINRGIHNMVEYSIRSNYQDTIQSLQIIENGLNIHQRELEKYFVDNGIDVYENWAFSIENRETIRELSEYIKLNTSECKDIPYHRLWQYFIAWACIQKKARQLLWKIETIPMDNFLQSGLHDMKFFCKYAVGIYGKLLVRVLIEKKWLKIFQTESDESILCNYAKIIPENLLYSHITSKKYQPAFAICVYPPKKSLILAIRGTMSVFDCMTDLKGDYTSYDYINPFTGEVITTGLVHSGIFLCAKNLAAEVKPRILEYLARFPDYSLYVVGHSLGAGASALLALIWMSDPEIMLRGFRALAYAPPAVVSAELNVHLKRHLFSCVFGNDLVSRLSFGAIKDLCEMVTFFHKRETSSEGIKASEIASSFIYRRSPDPDKMVQLYHEIKKSFTSYKLQPPGNVYQMYQREKHSDCFLLDKDIEESKQEYIGQFVNPEFHLEVAFSKTTLTDHMPNFYEQAINELGGADGVYTEADIIF